MRPGWWGLRTGPRGPYGNVGGLSANSGGCGCGCGTGCQSSCAVRLDPAPVIDITSVKIDGVVQPPSTYQVIDGNLLVRSPAAGCWPTCNDLSAPDTAPGTWSATYQYGHPPTKTAMEMASIYACEIAKYCVNRRCRLTGKITSLTRDGVSIDLDPMAFIDNGLTGLPEIDLWLRMVNPHALAQPSQVWTPETLPPRQVTWPAAIC